MEARQKKTLFVLVAGLAILAWRVYALVAREAPQPTHAQAPAPAQQSVEDIARKRDEARIAWMLEEQEKTLDLPWGRDIFAGRAISSAGAPEGGTASLMSHVLLEPPPAPNLRVTGVSRSGPRWLAAIDGNIVSVGDSVAEGFRVRSITRSAVTLESRGWGFTYGLGSSTPIVGPIGEVP